jgi:hypothetical protein
MGEGGKDPATAIFGGDLEAARAARFAGPAVVSDDEEENC